MYEVKVLSQFKDLTTPDNKIRKPGEKYIINDEQRLRQLLGNNKKKMRFVEITQAFKQCKTKYKDKKIIIYQDYLYFIGGIETFLFNLVKYYKDYDITILGRSIDVDQFVALSKYANVKIDDYKKFECDVLILGNYNCDYILGRAAAKKIYQMIHADWEGITKLPEWNNFKWAKNKKVDKIICVSDVAAEGLKKTMGYDSEVIYNILDDNYQQEDGMTFITLSRATPEKGIHRMVKMAKAFEEHNKKFIWFICCSLEQVKDKKLLEEIKSIPEFIIVPPSIYNKMLIKGCDYLVQLSDTESFCYSAYEALQRKVPVILTDFPEAKNIVDEGENGYIVDMELNNLDVEKIFSNKPRADYYIDRCDHDKWIKVFNGEI